MSWQHVIKSSYHHLIISTIRDHLASQNNRGHIWDAIATHVGYMWKTFGRHVRDTREPNARDTQDRKKWLGINSRLEKQGVVTKFPILRIQLSVFDSTINSGPIFSNLWWAAAPRERGTYQGPLATPREPHELKQLVCGIAHTYIYICVP